MNILGESTRQAIERMIATCTQQVVVTDPKSDHGTSPVHRVLRQEVSYGHA